MTQSYLKKSIGFFMLAIFLSLGAFAQEQITGNTQPEPGDKAALPQFTLTQPDGTTFSKSDLIKNQPVIVFYFDPDCDHCQSQAKWVAEKISDFHRSQMVWITWGELDATGDFANKYFPGRDKTILFGKDMNYEFDKWFGYSEVPSVYIYNAQWQRIASFNHETKAENILKVLGK